MPQSHTIHQHNDRIAVRDQALAILGSLVEAVKDLDRLPITSANNYKLRELRDRLSDLLESLNHP